MELDIEKIKQLRNVNAWSQEVLAKLSGLSLRTIQRVEKDGSCSPETHLALAAVFKVSPEGLLRIPNQPKSQWLRRNIMHGGLSMMIILAMIYMLVYLGGGVGLVLDFPSILFVFLFVYACTIVAYRPQGLVDSISGLKYVFSSKIYQSAQTDQLALIYSKQIEFIYGGAFIAVIMGSVAIHGNYSADWEPDVIHKAYAVNILVFFWAGIFAEGILRPLKAKFEIANLDG